ncbi:Holliday junction branch migration complex subunit RuvA [Candidatus Liberibacter solanacearum]|uniref:Holliday junction branch migration complex subunit RuvA n=2 Tax=Candidatus Liberibacter solanacearum TaxID=556287 RepID=A0A094Z1M7_9HYPH|nr:Holliday junction branch migration protein RuvA [Candidatus Liberibacter solanacearum]ADR52881.1 Holliday junction DNA helicase RuvA [Candidatus Liberibacter solanacearum CLso-ZC1]KGB27552.1 ATP-dependent DNA helicase RuvA [Candidatus Liberibacter solanacearum]KJZ80795.1 ATP-dependent DNA helicase RuvA [Candidatus Liberibacter solanacearum]KJZ81910.1 Holliday junction DNA helicase RuvA [Candidatus Liberibacter solanacearum]KQC49639.1 ATP-dependent DNA helicase RuvA [Candidatus Liberibacter 
MIGKIKGNIEGLYEDYVLIDVQGICYIVYCPIRTLSCLGKIGDFCTLFVETHVRQDQIRLFGFLSDLERKWFVLLQSVQGVGARVAMGVLSRITPVELVDSIILQNNKILAQIPGIGAKVSNRIMIELKGKAVSLSSSEKKEISCLNGEKSNVCESMSSSAIDAISALVNLGYGQDQATVAVVSILKKEKNITDDSQIIRLALREMTC